MRAKVIVITVAIFIVVAMLLLRQKRTNESEVPAIVKTPTLQTRNLTSEPTESTQPTNVFGDTLLAAEHPEFVNKVFPKFREFVGTLER